MIESQNLITSQTKTQSRYRADITAGSLKVAESRLIAKALLESKSKGFNEASLLAPKILKTRNLATAVRLGRLLKQRLSLFDEGLWKLIDEGSHPVATQACLAAAIKHSPLLGDFLLDIVQDQYQQFADKLNPKLWNRYLEACESRAPDMPQWTAETKRRLRSSVYQILAQAGYIESTRSPKLQKVHLEPEIVNYLKRRQESYVLRCMEVGP